MILIALENIASNNLNIKTFDYDGIKYKTKDAKKLIQQLQRELNDLNDKLKKILNSICQNSLNILKAMYT